MGGDESQAVSANITEPCLTDCETCGSKLLERPLVEAASQKPLCTEALYTKTRTEAFFLLSEGKCALVLSTCDPDDTESAAKRIPIMFFWVKSWR